MKALFRVDASPSIGSGHLARCLTLARALSSRGVEIEVATHAPSAHTLSWIEREGFRAVELAAAMGVAEVCHHADDAALVVVDGYSFDASFHAALRAPARVVCVIDDLADAPLGGDAVLNGNLYGRELRYDVATQLVGPEFALVREEFLAARARRLTRAEPGGARRLLVTMGGADPTRETDKALAALAQLPPLHVRVVVGGANPRVEEIRAACARVPGHTLELLVDVRDMAEMMEWADVALTASGSTCLELACVGVASVVVQVADNQRLVAASLASRQLMTVAGTTHDVSPEVLAAAVAALLEDPAARHRAEAAQRSVVDGRGPARAADALLALLPTSP